MNAVGQRTSLVLLLAYANAGQAGRLSYHDRLMASRHSFGHALGTERGHSCPQQFSTFQASKDCPAHFQALSATLPTDRARSILCSMSNKLSRR